MMKMISWGNFHQSHSGWRGSFVWGSVAAIIKITFVAWWKPWSNFLCVSGVHSFFGKNDQPWRTRVGYLATTSSPTRRVTIHRSNRRRSLLGLFPSEPNLWLDRWPKQATQTWRLVTQGIDISRWSSKLLPIQVWCARHKDLRVQSQQAWYPSAY